MEPKEEVEEGGVEEKRKDKKDKKDKKRKKRKKKMGKRKEAQGEEGLEERGRILGSSRQEPRG